MDLLVLTIKKKKEIQYRLTIKLKYTEYNHKMLLIFTKVPHIRGNVRIINNGTVIWVEDSKYKIKNIINNVFKVYPLLTSRKIQQLEFMCQYIFTDKLSATEVTKCISARADKYKDIKNYIASSKETMITPISYFGPWQSGFIEAEGCFSIRITGKTSFSIGQNDDKFIIERIKNYFGINSTVRLQKPEGIYWTQETYSIGTFRNIVNHIESNPQLGDKLINYNKFKIIVATGKQVHK